MKTKLLFCKTQIWKNIILSLLIIFFMTVSALGQTDGITFNLNCGSFSGTIAFGAPDNTTNGYPSWSNDTGLQGFSMFAEIGVNPIQWEIYGPGGPGGDILYLSSVVFVNGFPSCDVLDDEQNIVWVPGPNSPCSVSTIVCTGSPPDPDNDGDGFPASEDCNDNDATINPDATEVCDGIDNNCDGQIDEGFDADGDGVTTCGGDCDDLEPDVYPGAEEICDGLDNDCNGEIDEDIPDCNNGVILEYCNDKKTKILVCHNGKDICVSINAMSAHEAHGDYLGSCANAREGETIAEEITPTYGVVYWPNPTNDFFNVKMTTPNSVDKVSIKAFDLNGRLIHSNVINGNEDYQFGSNLNAGVYFVKITQADKSRVLKVIKR